MNKIIFFLSRWSALTFVLLFIGATSAPATVTIDAEFSGSFTEVSSPTDLAYDGDHSGSDLLNGLTATVATGWNTSNGSAVPELNDGIHGSFPGGDLEGTWSNEGAIAEYYLGANALGYNISAIQAIASFSDSGFGNQVWTVEVKPVGGSYALLATVNFTPFNGTAGATKVTLSGLNATGVESIRFTAGSTAGKSVGNDFVFREIDVVGAATPSTPDLTAPMVNSLTPADGAGNASLVDDLAVTFNEIIAIGTGNITIKNLDTGSQAVIPVGDGQVSVFGKVLTINPTVGLDPNVNYAIHIDANAITDIAGNSFAGILDNSTWNFTTASVNLVKVILLGGQSNAVGQGNNAGLPTSPVNLQIPQDDVLFYYTGGAGLTTLRPGSGGHPVATGGKFGVEVTFGREIADASPSVTYAIIKHAESGTALYNDWALGTGPSYTGFRNTVAAGLAALQNAGYTTEIVGMLWHQGESDALEGQQANYANNLMAFMADIRSRYGSNLPFIIGEIRHNGPAYMTVVNAQAAIAAADPFARFVPATDLSFYDFFHFDAAGLITLGERFATAFLDLIPSEPSNPVTIDSAFSGAFTAVNSPSDSAYEGHQSASDLLNGLTATVATAWNTANGSTVSELNDGIHGAFTGGDVDGTWSDEGAVVEYDLGPNADGYDINSIQAIASWTDTGFGNQVWTVEVKPVGGSYVLLATVDYAPFNNTGGATKINLTGLGATGIESIRFTAGSTAGKSAGNDFVFREIDVEGTAVPTASNVTIESGFSGSFTAVSSASDSAYEGDQSASDLLNGLTATVATGWNIGSGSTVPELNDGIHGGAPGGNAEGTWSNEGAIAEYYLGANALGYDINSIQAIASWTSAGFGNQVWTVEVKPVGGSYVLLATVDFTPFNNTGGATKVNLTGLGATGIESIRFTAGSTAGNSSGNDFVFREIDVEGTAVPSAANVTIESGFSGSFTEVSSAIDSAYDGDQSGSDLLNGLTATVATGWNLTNGSSVPELNDGIHGGFSEGDAEGTWSNEGAIVEYYLGSSAAGYDISSIQSIASWTDSGFGNQVWTVEVKPVGGSYTLLATVDSTPFNNTGGATKVNLTGLDAIGIESIRFTAGSTAGNSSGNDFVFREIDVEGTATPLPAVMIDAGFSGGYTAVSSATESAYEGDQSTSDLLNGLTATVATGWNTGSGSTVPELNDGIHGGSPGGNAEGTWSNEGAIAEYYLGANALGYDISSIQAIASWTNSGFGNQVWTVEVKPVGGIFTLLATVDYTPLNNTGGATKINLTGLDATGIESIRFTAGSTAGNSYGNDFVFREIDVFGAAASVTVDAGFSGSYTAVSSATEAAYEGDQSGADLLNGLTATVATGWNTGSGSTVPELNDGIHGGVSGGNAEGTWSNEGAIAEYYLGANALGYDISSIQAIASWTDAGFGNQVWTVEVKPVGGSYVLLATVDFTPFNNTGGATKVNLTGLDATGIESIRFTAGSTAGNSYGNDFVLREMDVFGVATPDPLRIMCLGDSLTVGYTDNPDWTHPFKFGYRSGLYTRLTDAEYNFQFVGASTEPWDGISGDPTHGGTYTPALDLRDFGQDGHRGYGGVGIWDNVDAYIAADKPDVILLMIGINDLHAGSQAALTNLVDSIVTTAPDVHLIVAQTSPFASFDQTLYDYNLYIRDTLVPTYAANGHKVSTVDLYTPFLVDPANYASAIKPGVMSNNFNHPVNTYYDLIAEEWYEGVQTLGLGPNAALIGSSRSVLGTVSGGPENADFNDGLYHTVTEEVVEGASVLEHEWEFDVLPGTTATFYVEAHHTANGEGDDFVFVYSTDGVVFDEMVMVSKTEDDDTTQSFTFPEELSGPITVIVQDTNDTEGNTQLDTVLIDAMFIVSEQ